MEKVQLIGRNFYALSEGEAILIAAGGGEQGWEYELAEYLGMGVGFSARKLWKAFKLLSSHLYKMRANPLLLYQ